MISTKCSEIYSEYSIVSNSIDWAVLKCKKDKIIDHNEQLDKIGIYVNQYNMSVIVEICKQIIKESASTEDAIKNINLKFGME